MSTLILCNIPELTISYEHSFDFANINNQINYFFDRAVKTVNTNTKVDAEKQSVVVDLTLDELKNCNYVLIQDNTGKYMFYFLTNKRYKTVNCTEIDIELDVIQTYMFDYQIMESFVDRMHVDRWDESNNIIKNNVDEGLECGDYIISEILPLKALTENYIITSTTPLGTFGDNTPPITSEELTDHNSKWGSKPDRIEPPWYDGGPGGVVENPDDDNNNGGESGGVITPDPNSPYDGFAGEVTQSLFNTDTIALSLVDNGMYGQQKSTIIYDYGEVIYSYGNIYTPYLTDATLKNMKRGTIIKTKPGTKIYIDRYSVNYSYIVYDKGIGNVPPNYPADFGVPQQDWGHWIMLRYNNISDSFRYRFFAFLDSPYEINYSLNGLQTNNSKLLYIGTVTDEYQYNNENIFFSQSTHVYTTENKVQIMKNIPYNKNIKNMKYGIHRYTQQEDLSKYPDVYIPTDVANQLGVNKMKCPTINASICKSFITTVGIGTTYYQVYTSSDSSDNPPLIIAPTSGVVVYSGNSFINTTSPFYTALHNVNTVLLKISENVYIEYCNLGIINVQMGDTVEAGAVIGTVNDGISRMYYKDASGSDTLIDSIISDYEIVNYSYNGFVFGLSFIIDNGGTYTRYNYINTTIQKQPFWNGVIHAGDNTDLMIALSLTPEKEWMQNNPEGFLSIKVTTPNGKFPDIDEYPLY